MAGASVTPHLNSKQDLPKLTDLAEPGTGQLSSAAVGMSESLAPANVHVSPGIVEEHKEETGKSDLAAGLPKQDDAAAERNERHEELSAPDLEMASGPADIGHGSSDVGGTLEAGAANQASRDFDLNLGASMEVDEEKRGSEMQFHEGEGAALQPSAVEKSEGPEQPIASSIGTEATPEGDVASTPPEVIAHSHDVAAGGDSSLPDGAGSGAVDQHEVEAARNANEVKAVSMVEVSEESGSDESEEEQEEEEESSSEESEETSSSEEEEEEEEKEAGEGFHELVRKELEAMEAYDEFGEDENGVLRTKHEVTKLPPVQPVEAQLQDHHKLQTVGHVSAIVGEVVVVQAVPDLPPLNEGSILWLCNSRQPLGVVDEVFGPVKVPLYQVRFNSCAEIPVPAVAGAAVGFVADFASFILNDSSLYAKGYDASGADDEEVGDDEVEFSDDEKEEEAKRLRKAKRKGQPGADLPPAGSGRGRGGRGGRGDRGGGRGRHHQPGRGAGRSHRPPPAAAAGGASNVWGGGGVGGYSQGNVNMANPTGLNQPQGHPQTGAENAQHNQGWYGQQQDQSGRFHPPHPQQHLIRGPPPPMVLHHGYHHGPWAPQPMAYHGPSPHQLPPMQGILLGEPGGTYLQPPSGAVLPWPQQYKPITGQPLPVHVQFPPNMDQHNFPPNPPNGWRPQ
eukprot:jgi/Mesen1/2600/ME000166S01719